MPSLTFLAPGYCYEQNGQIIVPSDSNTELTNVSVVPCDHTSSAVTTTNGSTITYKCPCGEVTYTGSVTKDGKTLYYAELQDASLMRPAVHSVFSLRLSIPGLLSRTM